jgi:hypothetical protein
VVLGNPEQSDRERLDQIRFLQLLLQEVEVEVKVLTHLVYQEVVEAAAVKIPVLVVARQIQLAQGLNPHTKNIKIDKIR